MVEFEDGDEDDEQEVNDAVAPACVPVIRVGQENAPVISISVPPCSSGADGKKEQAKTEAAHSSQFVPEDGVDSGDEKEEGEQSRRRPSIGGTIRHNCSTAQLLSDKERVKLLQWVARREGPWKADLEQFPGPDPLDASAAACGEAEKLASDNELYNLKLSGFSCYLWRNDYLAWCGSIELPPSHPDHGKRVSDISADLQVHGGLGVDVDRPSCFRFDCCHAQQDLVPYAAFLDELSQQKRVGLMAPSQPQPSNLGGSSQLGIPRSGMLAIPTGASAGPRSGDGRATYKDYAFARRELEGLASQFAARASSL
eukprot:TRINITY_DN46625_c0_g1_i1.p1 TRINITY_DN46625_c0_g1~~TRINITY_DN46625_c0_g1_i1.p1  ORF type:complete len:323 (+),score=45.44 TRINITY_DN46625_c0_g1_i1:36-971(+)